MKKRLSCLAVCFCLEWLAIFGESLTATADLRINGYLAVEFRQSKLFLNLIAGMNDRKLVQQWLWQQDMLNFM